MNHLITGYHNTPHVAAVDDRQFDAALFGTGKTVFKIGREFACEKTAPNEVTIYDGQGCDQGARFGIRPGESVALQISNGAQGYNRCDTLAFRYSRDASTMIETGEFVIVEGAPTKGAAEPAALESGDVLSGDGATDEMALYHIYLSGVDITDVRCVFTSVKPLASMSDDIAEVGASVSNLYNTLFDSLSLVGRFPAYGFTSNGNKDVFIFVHLPTIEKGKTAIVASLQISLRVPQGGYLGGTKGLDVTSFVQGASLLSGGTVLQIQLRDSSEGWNGNNIPVVGDVQLDVSLV